MILKKKRATVMEQTLGREKAKRNIVIFVIGVFITFIGSLLSGLSDVIGVSWLEFFGFLALVGGVFEIIAIILLRNVNKKYANALWALILYLLLGLTSFILILIADFGEDPNRFDIVTTWLDVAGDFAEALIVVNFVLGTNKLAEENNKGMPLLTKGVVYGYMGIFLIAVVFNILSLIPAIRENAVVLLVFSIIVFILYIIRSISYIFFLIKSLWRVE